MRALDRTSQIDPSIAQDSAASGQPSAHLPGRPVLATARISVDAALSYETWKRTEQFFHAIQAGIVDDVVGAYQPDAVLESPVAGQVCGCEIGLLWTTFLKRTRVHALDFTITNVSARTALVHWASNHIFFETGRPIRMSGATSLRFERGRICVHHDTFDRHRWLAQALGLSGLVLSYLPGSRAFFRDEIRRVIGLDQNRA